MSANTLNINLVEMIKTIRIQNFRSLQDVTLDLQDVNLLIGPNNSGKTNLMKALRFLGDFFSGRVSENIENLKKYFFLQKINDDKLNAIKPPITFTIIDDLYVYRFEFFGSNGNMLMIRQLLGTIDDIQHIEKLKRVNLDDLFSLEAMFSKYSLQHQGFSKSRYHHPLDYYTGHVANEFMFKLLFNSKEGDTHKSVETTHYSDFANSSASFAHSKNLREFFATISKATIYSVNISTLKRPYPTLEDDYSVKPDASNLVAFLDNMRDNKPQIMSAINANLKECIKEFESITFEKVRLSENDDLVKIYGNKTFKRLGVQDKFGQIYWADELSDGTLYFLALLAIIHQPDPPKLLMVEEPENGIHPRRIKEIIDYFFTIAQEKGIQVILTTHSTVVIDQFKDLPESIFVFDKKDQATQVKNLLTDIIEEDKILSKKNNVPALDLSGSLGDHWAAGLIGGVPK